MIVDVVSSLLEDLKAQLEVAGKKLNEAKDQANPDGVIYWGQKVKDLMEQITKLGG